MQAGSIVADIRARVDDFRAGVREAKDELNGLNNTAQDVSRKMNDVGKKWTKYVTAPIVGFGVAAVKTAADFEAAMNKVSALSGATGEDLKKLEDLAMKMGRETRYSAKEAAEGLAFLAMAGFNVEQSIAALPSVLEMAAAGGLDLGTAADYASNIMTGFGLEAEEMSRVTDVLAATFTSSNTNLSQLAEGMKYVAPIAAGLGIPIEEVAAAMGMLGDAGIQGSMAGTTLRQALQNLMNPTGSAAEVIERLGLVTTDANGEFVGFESILRQFEETGISTQDMMELFGSRGAGMIALAQQGSERYAEFVTELENADGTGKRVADTMLEGLSGSLTILKGSIETMLIVLGNRFLPMLAEWAEKAVDVVNRIAEMDDETLNFYIRLAGFAAAVGPVLIIGSKLIDMFIKIKSAAFIAKGGLTAMAGAKGLGAVATGAGATTTALGGAQVAAGTFGAKLAGMAAAGGTISVFIGALVLLGLAIKKMYDQWQEDQIDTESILEASLSRIRGNYAAENAAMLGQQEEHKISMIENELEMLLGLESHTDEQLKRIEELYAEHGKAKERQRRADHAAAIAAEVAQDEALHGIHKSSAERVIDTYQGRRDSLDEITRATYQKMIDNAQKWYLDDGDEKAYRERLRKAEAFLRASEIQNQSFLQQYFESNSKMLIEVGLIWDTKLQDLVPITERHQKTIMQTLTSFYDELGPDLKARATEAFNLMAEGTQESIEQGMAIAMEIFAELGVDFYGQAVEIAEDASGAFIRGMVEGIKSGEIPVQGALELIAIAIDKELDEIEKLAGEAGFDSMEAFIEALEKQNPEAIKVLIQLAADMDKQWEEDAKSAGEAGNEIGNQFVEGVGRTYEAARIAAGKLYKELAEGFKNYEKENKADSAQELGKNFGVSVTKGIELTRPDVKESGKKLVGSAAEGVKETGEIDSPSRLFQRFGQALGDGLRQGILDKIADVRGAAVSMAENARDAVQGLLPEWFRNIGVSVPEGFRDGVNSRASQAVTAAANMAEGALTAARQMLDSWSPSKEFYKLGVSAAEGMAGGIYDKAGEVADKAAALVRDAMNAARSETDRGGGGGDGDGDTGPPDDYTTPDDWKTPTRLRIAINDPREGWMIEEFDPEIHHHFPPPTDKRDIGHPLEGQDYPTLRMVVDAIERSRGRSGFFGADRWAYSWQPGASHSWYHDLLKEGYISHATHSRYLNNKEAILGLDAGGRRGMPLMHQGGIVGKAQSRVAQWINDLFQTRDGEVVAKLLEGEIVVNPAQGIDNLRDNLRSYAGNRNIVDLNINFPNGAPDNLDQEFLARAIVDVLKDERVRTEIDNVNYKNYRLAEMQI